MRGRAISRFLEDLFDGDPVALTFTGVVLAIARVAGWLAHWLEQLKNNRIFRPEQIYVGKRDVQYVPLEQRP